jgi:hypothetical protein
MFMSAKVRIFSWGERWNIPSFTEWKYSYHCKNENIHYLFYIIPNRLILLFHEQFIKTPFNIKINTHKYNRNCMNVSNHSKHKECNGIKRIAQLHSQRVQ